MTTSQLLEKLYSDYAIYVGESRAIPRMMDGLKSVQRIALWLMHNKTSKIKTISLAGEMIASNLYVHGDQAAAQAISALAAPYLNNEPLLTGEGNFGSPMSPKDWASPRYTYVSCPKRTRDLVLVDIDTLPQIENYDGSAKIPLEFRPIIPTILLNGTEGIAVGYRTNIFPRSLKNLMEAVSLAIANKPIPDHLFYPEYSAYNQKTTYSKTTPDGHSVWSFEGDLTIVDTSTIEVTSIPVMISTEDFKKYLDELEESKKIVGFEDHSSQTIKILIRFPRGSLKGVSKNDLIELLKLRRQAQEMINVLDERNKIKSYVATTDEPIPARQLLKDWVKARLPLFNDRISVDLNTQKERLIYAEALKACFEANLPGLAKTLASRQAMIEKILTIINVDRRDIAEKIADRRTYAWTQEVYQTILDDIKDAQKQIETLSKQLGDPGVWKTMMIQHLKAIKP